LERLIQAERRERGQALNAGADKPRERARRQIYRAYLRQAERLREYDAPIVRVVLDRGLKHGDVRRL
jgi:hypothetical protein